MRKTLIKCRRFLIRFSLLQKFCNCVVAIYYETFLGGILSPEGISLWAFEEKFLVMIDLEYFGCNGQFSSTVGRNGEKKIMTIFEYCNMSQK